MSWKRTLIFLILIAAALIYVLRRESGEERGGERRLEAGLLYPHEASAIRRAELAYPDRSFRVERRGEAGEGSWWLTAPVEDLGDSVVIDRMLATLAGQKVTRWLPPVPADSLAAYGLAAPRLELRLETDAGWDTLRFGALNELEKRLWVQTSWRDSLALVSTLLRTNAMMGRYQLVDKRPMGNLPLSRVESFEIDNARGRFELVRGKRGWEIRRPEPYRADDRTVIRMLNRLFGPSILEFDDGANSASKGGGFQNPRARMTAKLSGGAQPRVLEVGQRYYDLHRLRNRDRPHAFLVDSVTVTPLLESFSAFLSQVLVSYMPGRVRAVTGPDGLRVLKQAEGPWVWADEAGRTVSGKAISVLLNRILRLPTERVEALLPRQDQLRQWGLDPPDRRFGIELENGLELVVEFGWEWEGRVAFRRADFPTVYSLEAASTELPWPPHSSSE